MKRFSRELQIGLFIILACVVGAYFWHKTASSTDTETYNLKTSFNFAGGLKANSMVMLSGIEVGRIVKIDFEYENGTKVLITFLLNKNAKVRTDSLCYIGTAGFIGDAFLGITPGSP